MSRLHILAGTAILLVLCCTLWAGQKVVYDGDTVVSSFEGSVLKAKAKTIVAFDDAGIPQLISAETPDHHVEAEYGLDDNGNPKNTGRLVFEGNFNFVASSSKDTVTYHLAYLEITSVLDKKAEKGRKPGEVPISEYRGWILKAIASDNKAESISQKKTIMFDLPADRVLPIDNGRLKIGDAFISIYSPYTLGGVLEDPPVASANSVPASLKSPPASAESTRNTTSIWTNGGLIWVGGSVVALSMAVIIVWFVRLRRR